MNLMNSAITYAIGECAPGRVLVAGSVSGVGAIRWGSGWKREPIVEEAMA